MKRAHAGGLLRTDAGDATIRQASVHVLCSLGIQRSAHCSSSLAPAAQLREIMKKQTDVLSVDRRRRSFWFLE
jgi:hypothetical protein